MNDDVENLLPLQHSEEHGLTEEERPEDDWKFYMQAIQAWRFWEVVDIDGVLLLQSISYKIIWIPQQELIAECMGTNTKHRYGPHGTPSIEHGCGIYSLKEEKSARLWLRMYHMNTYVWGMVSIWGNVFEFTKGYLSEFAYPSKIFVPKPHKNLGAEQEEVVRELTTTYKVEAVKVDTSRDKKND